MAGAEIAYGAAYDGGGSASVFSARRLGACCPPRLPAGTGTGAARDPEGFYEHLRHSPELASSLPMMQRSTARARPRASIGCGSLRPGFDEAYLASVPQDRRHPWRVRRRSGWYLAGPPMCWANCCGGRPRARPRLVFSPQSGEDGPASPRRSPGPAARCRSRAGLVPARRRQVGGGQSAQGHR